MTTTNQQRLQGSGRGGKGSGLWHLPVPRIVLVEPIQLTSQRRNGGGKRSTHALDPSQRDLIATKDLRATVVAGAAHVEDFAYGKPQIRTSAAMTCAIPTLLQEFANTVGRTAS